MAAAPNPWGTPLTRALWLERGVGTIPGGLRASDHLPTCAEGQGFEAADRVRTQLVKLSIVTMSRSAEPGTSNSRGVCGPGVRTGLPIASCRSGVRFAPEDGTDSSQDGSGSVPAGTRLRVGNFVDEPGGLNRLPSSCRTPSGKVLTARYPGATTRWEQNCVVDSRRSRV